MGLSRILSSKRILAIVIGVLVVASIIVAYAFGGGYTDRIYIEFSDEFRIYSKGFVNIIVMSPHREKMFKFSVDDVIGKRMEIDVRDIVKDFIDYYKNLTPGYKGPLFVPQISVTLFYYNGSQECIANYVYTTRDWFMDQGYSMLESREKALQNPMAMLERMFFQAPVIRFRVKMPTGSLKPVCTDFTPAIEMFAKERYGYSMNKSLVTIFNKTVVLEDSRLGRGLTVLPVAKAQTSVGKCRLYLTTVRWWELYSTKDSPPPGWYANITGIPDYLKKAIWRWYASNFSVQYWWEETSDCTSIDAILATSQFICYSANPSIPPQSQDPQICTYLTQPGVMNMDSWLWYAALRIGNRPYSVNWIDRKDRLGVPSISIGMWVPFLGVKVWNPNNKLINSIATIGANVYQKVHKGWAFLGNIIWGESQEQLYGIGATAACLFGNPCQMYVVYRATLTYTGDVMVIMYDVSEAILGGKRYWVVTPIATPFPSIRMSVDYSSVDTQTYPSTLYEFSYNTGVDEKVLTAYNVPPYTRIYLEEPPYNNVSADLGEKLLLLGVNIAYSAVVGTISTLVSPYLPPPYGTLAGFFISLIGGFFSYANEDLYQVALWHRFEIQSENQYFNYISLRIVKHTLKYRVQYYNVINFRPTLIIYEVYID